MKMLNDGHQLPALGFGTYKLRGDEGIDAIVSALEVGYRLLDTALNYENEREVGEAIRRSGVPRDEVFVTTKLPGRHHGFDEALLSFEESRMNLGLDYVDLYLIHWPLPRVDKYVETFRAMLELRDEGVVRSVGVSNFTEAHLMRVIDETGVTPAVNQIELHPRFPQGHMREFHARHNILTECWSPLARGSDVREEPVVTAIADAHGVTPTQVVLRWHVQLGAVPIPKSSTPERQRENFDVFGFELSHAEIASISSLESGRLWGGDPDTNEEF
jgi:diketogulonate reductase-like aldo/keto reductase